MSSTNHPFMRSPGQAIPLIAVETDPEGVCLVTEDTEVELREEPISGFEKTGGGITYEDIGGLQGEIQRVREMVELPMKHPQIFKKLGIEPPQGVLLHGPPGTGKTLLGEGSRQRDVSEFLLHRRAGDYLEILRRIRTATPRDIRGRKRGVAVDHLHRRAGLHRAQARRRNRRSRAPRRRPAADDDGRPRIARAGHRHRRDEPRRRVDPALRRPGRFDREIEIGVPDEVGREEILQIHTRGMPLSDDVSLDHLADETHGFVGADIER